MILERAVSSSSGNERGGPRGTGVPQELTPIPNLPTRAGQEAVFPSCKSYQGFQFFFPFLVWDQHTITIIINKIKIVETFANQNNPPKTKNQNDSGQLKCFVSTSREQTRWDSCCWKALGKHLATAVRTELNPTWALVPGRVCMGQNVCKQGATHASKQRR